MAVTFICGLHNSRQSLGRGGRLVGICHYSWVRSLAEVLRCAPARPNIGLKIFAKYLFRQTVGRRRAASIGIELSAIDLREAGEIERDVEAFARGSNGGLIVTGSSGRTTRILSPHWRPGTDCPQVTPSVPTSPTAA